MVKFPTSIYVSAELGPGLYYMRTRHLFFRFQALIGFNNVYAGVRESDGNFRNQNSGAHYWTSTNLRGNIFLKI